MFSSIIKIWSESKKKPHTRKFMYMGRVAVWYVYVNTLLFFDEHMNLMDRVI